MLEKKVSHLELQRVRLFGNAGWGLPSPDLHFVFPIRGSADFVSINGSTPLSAGDVVIVRGGDRIKLTALEGGIFDFCTFSLRLEHLLPLFTTAEFALLAAVSDRLGDGKTYPSSARLSRECHRLIAELPPGPGLQYRSQLLRIAAMGVADGFQSLKSQRREDDPRENYVLEAVEHLSPGDLIDLPVGHLAARFGCSRRHLNRIFQHHFNYSVATLKMEVRLLKALSLLRDPKAKVIEVAAECGFNHLGLFNTCFRKRFGTSPTLWRRGSGRYSAPSVNAEKEPPALLQFQRLCRAAL